MCGNGIRVMARYLVERGHQPEGIFAINTRDGIKHLRFPKVDDISVNMGKVSDENEEITASVEGKIWNGYNINVGNPHAVVFVEKIEDVYKDTPRVSVVVYNELTSTLAKKYEAQFLVRGLRNTTDFEYENTISQMNRYLNGELDTVFLITAPQYAAISSTVIREVHRYGGDVAEFLPYSL